MSVINTKDHLKSSPHACRQSCPPTHHTMHAVPTLTKQLNLLRPSLPASQSGYCLSHSHKDSIRSTASASSSSAAQSTKYS
jgi:hypothetical protein